MVVRIRLARFGRKNRPFYRIVAIDSRKARQGQYLELLGTYNPLQTRDGAKEIRLKTDRIKYWLSEGAQPSDTTARLLGLAGILPMPPIRYQPTKSVPKSEREFHTLPDFSGSMEVGASGASEAVAAQARTTQSSFNAACVLAAGARFAPGCTVGLLPSARLRKPNASL